MFEISTATAYSKSVIKTVASMNEARAYADRCGATIFDIDEDYPECADFLAAGQVYSVQPVGFTVA